MDQNRLVVYLVTYNRLFYLKQAMESIFNQTFRDYSLCILDNCSTDGTEEYVTSIKDERIKYIRHEKNIGGVANIAYAFDYCEGDYFAVFHDDDILHSTLLEEEISYLEDHDECVAVSCLSNNIDENGNYTKYIDESAHSIREFSGRKFFEEYINNQRSLTFSATLYRTSFIKEKKIRFKSSPGPCADVVLYMDIEKEGGTLTEIPKVLIDYRIYKNQDSSSHLEEMLIKLVKYLSEDKYYSILLMNDGIGRKKYFNWYFRRLLVREVSKYIKYCDAQNYLEMMYQALETPVKSIKGYKMLLWTTNLLVVPANMAYRVVKKAKRIL